MYMYFYLINEIILFILDFPNTVISIDATQFCFWGILWLQG